MDFFIIGLACDQDSEVYTRKAALCRVFPIIIDGYSSTAWTFPSSIDTFSNSPSFISGVSSTSPGLRKCSHGDPRKPFFSPSRCSPIRPLPFPLDVRILPMTDIPDSNAVSFGCTTPLHMTKMPLESARSINKRSVSVHVGILRRSSIL
jgi:hypothetical protein